MERQIEGETDEDKHLQPLVVVVCMYLQMCVSRRNCLSLVMQRLERWQMDGNMRLFCPPLSASNLIRG